MSDFRDGNSGRPQGGVNHSPPRAGRPRSEDPLAELARLIDEDPFADFDRPRHAQGEPRGHGDEADRLPGDWTLDTSWPRYEPPSGESGHSDAGEAAPSMAEAGEGDDGAAPHRQHEPEAQDVDAEHFRQSLEAHFRQGDLADPQDSEPEDAGNSPAVEPDPTPEPGETDESDIAWAQAPDEPHEVEVPSHAPSGGMAPARSFDAVSAVAAQLLGDEPPRDRASAAQGGSAMGTGQPINPFIIRPPEAHDIVRHAPLAAGQERPSEPHATPPEDVPVQVEPTDYSEAGGETDGWQDGRYPAHEDLYAEAAYEEAAYAGEQPYHHAEEQAGDRAYDVESDFPPEIYEDAARRPRRGLLIVTSLVGLVVVGGAVAMAYRGISSEPSGEPPVIRAEATPTKIIAEVEEPAAEEGQGKLVYDRIGGNATEREERLVSREEPVFEVAGRDGPAAAGDSTSPTAATEEMTAPASARTEPRRVRTVVVRPDGTIIPPSGSARRDEPASGGTDDRVAAAIPQEPQFVPPSAPQPEPPELRQPEQSAPAAQAGPAQQDEPAQREEQPEQAQQAEQPQPAEQQQAQQPQPAAEQRSGRPLQLVPGAGNATAAPTTGRTETAALPSAPEEPASRPAGQPFPSGAYVVQVSSTRSEQEARAAASTIAQRHGSLLGNYRMGVERADLGDRGVFYRVAAGSMSERAEAISLCESLKANGLDCFVRLN